MNYRHRLFVMDEIGLDLLHALTITVYCT